MQVWQILPSLWRRYILRPGYILPHWQPPPTCGQNTEQWKTPITEGREFYLSASPVEMLFQRLRSVLKHSLSMNVLNMMIRS